MKILMIYTVGASGDLADTSLGSNVWYIRRYEEYFDHVHSVSLMSGPGERVTHGRTTLIPLGSGNRKVDLLLAPWRLQKIVRELKPTHLLTSDLVWSWWLSSLVRLSNKARNHVLPLVIPETIYRTSGKSISIRLPIWFEKGLISLTYLSADRILTGRSTGEVSEWFLSHRFAGPRTFVTDALVESLPPPAFFEQLQALENVAASKNADGPRERDSFRLIYVGRLNHEKMVDDLLRMMREIKQTNQNSHDVRLTIVGDGPERATLEKLANELQITSLVDFKGYVTNDQLPQLLYQSHAFVSPLTGCSLREAALCGVPIVAYDIDWVSHLLKHDENALLVECGDFRTLAREVDRLRSNPDLRQKLSANVKQLAWKIWSPHNLRESLSRAFSEE